MKKNLLLLILFVSASFSTALIAQNYTVSPNPAFKTVDIDNDVDPDDIVAEAHITNNTSDSLFLRWERIDNNKPECWETAVCDVNLCYFPTVSSMDFVLLPNLSSGEMLVHAYPDGTPGDAEIKIRITNLNDPADSLICVYNFTATGGTSCITAISEIELEALKIYPNPASNYFQMTETQEVQNLVVYNILGRQVQTFAVNNNERYDVSALPNGIYLVGMMDKNHQVIKTVKLQKY